MISIGRRSAKTNYVDNSVTDQTAIIRFIEDNWLRGQRIGSGSFDRLAGSVEGMFDFRRASARKLPLDPATGRPQSLARRHPA